MAPHLLAGGILAATALFMMGTVPLAAQEQKPAQTAQEPDLTPEEAAERESRKACKVEICAAFHNRKAEGGDITCNVVKTWRKEQLDKLIAKAKVAWPWGRVQCAADIKLQRATLIKAMTEPKHEATLDRHQVTCRIELEKDHAEVKFDFAPKVTFEGGKATKAALNWGKIEAPTLVKGAMWTATATDNTFNVLQSSVVDDINDFITTKCMEVKDEWMGK